MSRELPSCSATKAELVAGLYAAGHVASGKTRDDLIREALAVGCLLDIDERAWLCRELGLDYEVPIELAELVQLALDSGVDFNGKA